MLDASSPTSAFSRSARPAAGDRRIYDEQPANYQNLKKIVDDTVTFTKLGD